MQISTSVLSTLTAVTLMRFAAILLDRTHAHVKQDSQAMEKHALVSCCGVAKQCVCLYFLYSIFTFKHVEDDRHITSMVRNNNYSKTRNTYLSQNFTKLGLAQLSSPAG